MRAAYARLVVFLRWPIVVAWVAATIAAVALLPSIDEQAGVLEQPVPADAPALEAQRAAVQEFGFPLQPAVALVQRDPDGLSLAAQARVVRQAAGLTRSDETPEDVVAAVPIVDRDPIPHHGPGSTTAITYLFIGADPSDDPLDLGRDTAAVAERLEPDLPEPLVTGAQPAQIASADAALHRVWLLELATAAVVVLLVGLHLRSLVAPLLTLACVALAYVVAMRVLGRFAAEVDVGLNDQVRPVIVALMFGVVTDYTIFFTGRMRQRLRAGRGPKDAARDATRDLVGIVTAAALTIALASAALTVARFELFHAFGAAMAVTVVVAWLVVVTLGPALMAILGRRLFWPSRVVDRPEDPEATADATGEPVPRGSRLVLRFATRFRVLTVVLCLAALGAAASGLLRIDLEDPAIVGLPDHSQPARGLDATRAAFPAGVLSPLEVIVRAPDLDEREDALAALEQALERRPDVAAVLGPGALPDVAAAGVLTAEDGGAARMLVVPRAAPLTAEALDLARALQDDLDGLAAAAGLTGADTLVAGDAALIAQTIDRMVTDLLTRIAPAVLLVVFLVLVLYLRAIVAPLYLMAASVAALLAALGLTALLFQDLLGAGGIDFFVPIVAFVLLVGLGSDYNVYLVGRIWDQVDGRPLRETVVDAGARAASSIAAAGVVLAASFALLAIIPTARFEQAAFAIAVGLLIDTFLVRGVLIPAVIALVGRRSAWPGGRLRRAS